MRLPNSALVASEVDRILEATDGYYRRTKVYERLPDAIPRIRIRMRTSGEVESITSDTGSTDFIEAEGRYTILRADEKPQWEISIVLSGGRQDSESGYVTAYAEERRDRVLAARHLIKDYGFSPDKKFSLTFRGDVRHFPELDMDKLGHNEYTLGDIAVLDYNKKVER